MTLYPPLWSEDVERRVREAAEDRDPQQRPTEVRFCKKCVISNQRPRVTFDDDGVCSACRYAEYKNTKIDWDARNLELRDVLKPFRNLSSYDVIVPCSGGKDSASVALGLRDEGMHPLCALWEPHMYTDIGRRNLDAFVHHGGFDVVKAQPNGLLHRRMARLAFEFYGDPFMPFVYGQMCWPMWVAVQNGIRLVFYGENGEAEYGGDLGAAEKAFWGFDDWDRVYNKGVGVRDLMTLGVTLGAFTDSEASNLSRFYRLPPRTTLEEMGIQVHWWGYYRRWHPQENYYTAVQRSGFEANDERSQGTYSKYASLDDKLDGLHYFMAYAKFGMGRATSDAAHEIRDGDIDRDEAIALVKRYDGEWPERHLDQCCAYLGIEPGEPVDADYLDVIIDRFRPAHLWEGGNLRHAVWGRE